MKYKYGEYTDNQIANTKQKMRKKIFFLLLCVDPNTCDNYKDVNVKKAFDSLLREFAGLNSLLLCPEELVSVMSLLESALIEYEKPDFKFSIYRKLVLDAGSKVNEIKEV